jgi:hypothetical protein
MMKVDEAAITIAAGLSLGCAVHCMAMPLVLALAPLASVELWVGDVAEALLLGMSVAFSVGTLCWGYRVHGQPHVFALFVAALTALAVGELVRHPWHAGFVVGGASLLAASQLLNRRLCRRCHDCEASAADH